MLDKLFISLLNMSIISSYVIVFVLIARLFLKKAPKIFSYALWGIVLFRLLSPFSFESVLSLMPVAKTSISQDIIYSTAPQISTGIAAFDSVVNPMFPMPRNIGESINPIQVWLFIGAVIWAIGMAIMVIYSVVSFIKLKQSLIGAAQLKANIYLADHITSPFVMGLFKPKIYLPSSLSDSEKDFITLHEMCHTRRFDHVTRILAFAALTIHWFNPLVWIAFIASGKDMELSCDEAVMKKMDTDIRAEYSQSLLRFGAIKRMIHATPLAFGEGDTKKRVKNVLSYKKPAFWVVVVSVIVVVAVGVGLVANPKEKLIGKPSGFTGVNAIILKIDSEGKTMVVEGIDQNSAIGDQCILDWSNANLQTIEADGNLKTLSINDFAAGDYVVLFLDELQETYPTRAKASTVQLQYEALLNAMRPMIMVAGVLYLDTGKEVSSKIEDSAILGEITSAALASEKPTENGQCNFNSGVGAEYAVYEDGVAVFLDNKWFFFEKEATVSSDFPIPQFGTKISETVNLEKGYESVSVQDITREQVESYIKVLQDNGWTAVDDFNQKATIGGLYQRDTHTLSAQFAGDILSIYYSVTDNVATLPDYVVSAEYSFMKVGKNGEVLASYSLTNQELAKEIIMDGLVKSAAWDGVDISTVEHYIIYQSFAETSETSVYYAFLLPQGTEVLPEGAPVLQSGLTGMYSSLSSDLYLQLVDSFRSNDNLFFWVKPDEPPQYIGETAAGVWLKSFMNEKTPTESRISDYEITGVTVISGEPKKGVKWEDMAYQYVVQVTYNITTSTEQYLSAGDGVSGKGSFQGLFRELCVKVKTGDGGGFQIVAVGTGGGEHEFLRE